MATFPKVSRAPESISSGS